MKKLMVLSLVLAVCGLANAGLALVANDNVANVASDNGSSYAAFIVWKADLPVVGFGLTAAGNKDLSFDEAVDAAELGFGGATARYFSAASSTGALAAGNHYAVEFAPSVQLFDQGNSANEAAWLLDGDSLEVLGTLYTVPEPMTMGLLSLGALFLRKRK